MGLVGGFVDEGVGDGVPFGVPGWVEGYEAAVGVAGGGEVVSGGGCG